MSTHITVPLLDLKAQYDAIRDEIEPVVREVIESQWFIMGPNINALEEDVARYCHAEHAVGCASGSDAILLALMALGVGPGDEVIVPTYTFFSTAGSVHRLGAKPVFADIDPVTYNVTADTIRQAAGCCKNLKAIMPVHLFGQMVDMPSMIALGKELGVPVIEDAAQAIGSRDASGAWAGQTGDIGCFSFFPSKNLGAFGDGGICTTNNDSYAEVMAMLRNHGGKPKYYHRIVGLNSRLDAMHAAVLRVKLPYLDGWTEGRQKNAAFYDKAFADAGAKTSATPLHEGGLPIRTPEPAPAGARHIYNQYVIRVPEAIRDELRAHLGEKKIGNEVYYPVPLHRQDCFADLGYTEGALPLAEQAAKETIAIPIYPECTDEQKKYVVDTIVAYVNAHATVTA
ncbi:MAG: DegT/DnrJ/EryC1/StrS family aminotransferase [Planctomycetota bacterium]